MEKIKTQLEHILSRFSNHEFLKYQWCGKDYSMKEHRDELENLLKEINGV